MVKFIYTGVLLENYCLACGFDDISQLCELAHRYGILPLQNCCEELLTVQLN
jgi:hypothetical protein